MPKFFVVGLTHIDLAWKKDSQEHEEIMEKAVVQLLDVLDTVPGYTYVIEQAAHYRTMARRRPDLVARLRTYVRSGRLEFAGGLASTLETNGPSGESFVRNQILGLRFVDETFGSPVRTGYLIDTFGTHAQVPQILRQFGLKGLLANRFGGTLAKDVFVVRGLDGTPLLVAGRDSNSPYVSPERVFFRTARSNGHVRQLFEEAASTKADGPCLVMPYTEYDGIASRLVSELLNERNADDEGAWAFGTVSGFFDALPGPEAGWPEYSADLNPEFTGTSGQRIEIRCVHRAVETALIEADMWSVLLDAPDQPGSDDAWWVMAFVQSHDVYTGSHPTVVFNETMARLEQVGRYAKERIEACAASLATPGGSKGSTLIVMNGLPWPRDAVVDVALPDPQQWADIRRITDGDTELPFEVVDGRLRFRTSFPGVSVKRIGLHRGPAPDLPTAEPDRLADASAGQEASAIANEHVTVRASVTNGIDIVPAAGWHGGPIGLDLTLQEDRGSFQIEDLRAAEIFSRSFVTQVCPPQETALGSRLVVKGRFPSLWTGHTHPLDWEATLTIYPGKPHVDLVLVVDWRGEASRIRLAVQTGFESSTGIFEIPFGAVKRTPYHSRRTAKGEWPAHRWVAVEENGCGVALINTGNASAEVAGGSIRTTLLRAPVVEYAGMVPDDTSSQHGRHVLAFSVLAYSGSWTDGDPVRLGQEANAPVRCVPVSSGELARRDMWLDFAPSTVVLSGVKAPEDGEPNVLIVRVYEAVGRPTTARLHVRGAESAWKSDMREKKGTLVAVEGQTIAFDLAPFEIRTIRVRTSSG